MKIFKQLTLILIIWAVGEYFSSLLTNIVAIPGSIIGMILLFFLLLTNIVKLEHIKETSDFLLNNIAFFFIPSGIALLNYMDILKANWLSLSIIIILSTIIVMGVTSLVVNFMIGKKES
ncbi:CidA/LrgA family protein [Oceanirhabdus sp. W0125-5]|uniref:CidA/LrgA family protein n=1 Tax=Oceanirhabdus sp. W0125-5 TaxID=2999116 RepID=UPI0022F33E69|nr:CidA/LrgA family protein [Oceanirhabdus sp. W0125-5]WBW99003.1 CidA/LrgA family protein [Oceanirhabdus sp. W0125-5]